MSDAARSDTVASISGGPATAIVDDDLEKSSRSLKAWATRLAARHSSALLAGWAIVALLWLAIIPAAYLFWFDWLPSIWSWATEAGLSQVSAALRLVGAAVGSLFLLVGPIWIAMIAYSLSGFAASISLAEEVEKVRAASEAVRDTEQEALERLERLEDTDLAGLLPLLRYSRAQLVEYYTMGLQQTRRSFFHAAIAMWLGFLLLIAGIFLYIGPVEQFGMRRPEGDFNVLVISGAVIVEVISALFLWVYRSTISQITFYYRLQMRTHTAILCFRMAHSMTNGDAAKLAIVTSMLDSSILPDHPQTQGSSGLMGLLRAASAPTAGPAPAAPGST